MARYACMTGAHSGHERSSAASHCFYIADHGIRMRTRVELHPATDAWMQGDRFGVVERIGKRWIYVRLDRSQRILPFSLRNLSPIKES